MLGCFGVRSKEVKIDNNELLEAQNVLQQPKREAEPNQASQEEQHMPKEERAAGDDIRKRNARRNVSFQLAMIAENENEIVELPAEEQPTQATTECAAACSELLAVDDASAVNEGVSLKKLTIFQKTKGFFKFKARKQKRGDKLSNNKGKREEIADDAHLMECETELKETADVDYSQIETITDGAGDLQLQATIHAESVYNTKPIDAEPLTSTLVECSIKKDLNSAECSEETQYSILSAEEPEEEMDISSNSSEEDTLNNNDESDSPEQLPLLSTDDENEQNCYIELLNITEVEELKDIAAHAAVNDLNDNAATAVLVDIMNSAVEGSSSAASDLRNGTDQEVLKEVISEIDIATDDTNKCLRQELELYKCNHAHDFQKAISIIQRSLSSSEILQKKCEKQQFMLFYKDRIIKDQKNKLNAAEVDIENAHETSELLRLEYEKNEQLRADIEYFKNSYAKSEDKLKQAWAHVEDVELKYEHLLSSNKALQQEKFQQIEQLKRQHKTNVDDLCHNFEEQKAVLVCKYEAKIAQKNAFLQIQNDRFVDEQNKFENQIRDQQREIEELKGKSIECQRLREGAKEKNAEIDNLMAQLNERNHNLKLANEQLRKEKEVHKNHEFDWEKERAELERELHARLSDFKQEAADRMNFELSKQEKKLQALYEAEKAENLKKLQESHLTELNEIKSNSEKKVLRLQRVISEKANKLQQQTKDFQAERNNLEKELVQVHSELERAQQEFMTERNNNSKKQKAAMDALRKDFDAECNQLKKKYSEDLQKMNDFMEGEKMDLRKQLQEQKNNELEQEKCKLTNEKAKALHELEQQLKIELTVAQKAIEELRLAYINRGPRDEDLEQITELERRAEDSHNAFTTLSLKMNELTAELNFLRNTKN